MQVCLSTMNIPESYLILIKLGGGLLGFVVAKVFDYSLTRNWTSCHHPSVTLETINLSKRG